MTFTRRLTLPACLLIAALISFSLPASPQGAAAKSASSPPGYPPLHSNGAIGIFDGQSDIGSAKLPGSAAYDPATKQYTISSAGYNTVYTRDEFHYVWKKMTGDVSLAADIAFPDPNGYDGRKAMLVIRQNLDDDSREAVVALYGTGVFAEAQRPNEGRRRRDMSYRVWSKDSAGNATAKVAMPRRISLRKYGDAFILYVSIAGEPLHPFGAPLILHMDSPFYLGIGFCSNLPDKSDSAVFSDVVVDSHGILAPHTATAAPPTPLPTRTIP